MGNVFYFDWEVSLIEWLQQNMGTAGTYAAKIASVIGGETGRDDRPDGQYVVPDDQEHRAAGAALYGA